ncbi:uncharacterized protein FOMMEDRAFT_22741 [Fomitiporia mediterranea MF3/22]|uniref:uncharacterized protein n=1 Tax=Fomitiporia mediterranea (strain MF3/22) TaxID=694068 RepID=UPI0004407D6E|nr:uncharacterized protein FOMMEDRAFT_22741 [Fomitiporia mediterranea MF3/22]EJC99599.1 hypothetical protein FOMMEDRAFT_22741 [Fomitiporia mediterranea MF3/22]
MYLVQHPYNRLSETLVLGPIKRMNRLATALQTAIGSIRCFASIFFDVFSFTSTMPK